MTFNIYFTVLIMKNNFVSSYRNILFQINKNKKVNLNKVIRKKCHSKI